MPGTVRALDWSGLLGGTNAPAIPSSPQNTQKIPEKNARLVQQLAVIGAVMKLVKKEYVDPVDDQKLLDNALDGMINNLDPHSSYMTPQQLRDMQEEMSGEFGGLGLQVQLDGSHLRVIAPLDGTPASRGGVQPGDVITMVNHRALNGLPLDQAVREMRGKPGTKISLTILRPKTGKLIELSLKREIIHAELTRSFLFEHAAYIRLSEFGDGLERDMRRALQKLKREARAKRQKLTGVVLDVRSNPGGKLDEAISVCRDFIANGQILSIRGRHPEDDRHWEASGRDIANGLPIIVITNSGSASASEIVAGALQDHRRGLILGTRTFGKGSVQTIIPLGTLGAVRLTTARYYTPSGRSIQGHGITPDIEIHEAADEDGLYAYHETDLAHVLSNTGNQKTSSDKTRKNLQLLYPLDKNPPKDWPSFDLLKPETDFQLQQAVKLLKLIDQKIYPLSAPTITPPTASAEKKVAAP